MKLKIKCKVVSVDASFGSDIDVTLTGVRAKELLAIIDDASRKELLALLKDD